MPSITIAYPAGDGQRFSAALGKHLGLMTASQPGESSQPRAATAAECKAWLIMQAKNLIENVERQEFEAARGPVVVPDVDMT